MGTLVTEGNTPSASGIPNRNLFPEYLHLNMLGEPRIMLQETIEVTDKQYSFYLPVALMNRVKEYGKQNGVRSASAVVEQLVSEALRTKGLK